MFSVLRVSLRDSGRFGTEKDLEVKKKAVPLHSHLKNGWLMRPGVLTKTDAWRSASKTFFENFF